MSSQQTSPSGLSTIITDPRGNEADAWSPAHGDELQALVQEKLEDQQAREDVICSTLSILGTCVPPDQREGGRTGLVVGKVQSGKTLSFTAVMAAACDNSYRMVIVLAGTKKILAQQTRDRIKRDLRIEDDPSRPWRAYHNPSAAVDLTSIRGVLNLWSSSGSLPGMRQTIVITVHKNRQQLSRLRELLEQLDHDDLRTVLIVDDEADQASLNREVNQGTHSATYRAILELRHVLPSHTYLQYTATPQGNLLISFLDLLSPDFAAVLQPGRHYVGGPEMFGDRMGHYILETIPPHDIPDDDDPPDLPPPSLHRAMRLFLIGVADWAARGFPKVNGTRNRSMMVHPSRLKDSHNLFARWAKTRLRDWQRILGDDENADREAVIDEFRAAHEDLARTVPAIRPFEKLVPLLPSVVQLPEVRVVNSDQSIDIPWHQSHAWLLIGGANLDRGFTLEGLTVTYMPRGRGVGNADTIQQRGRFFGYKSDYLSYCRVFLEQEVGRSFRQYVRHEHSIHAWLTRSIQAGVPLRELPRRFLIDPALKPTRAAILTEDVRRARLRQDWFRQETVLESIADCLQNGERIDRFIRDNSLSLREDEPPSYPDNRTAHQRHQIVTGLPLRDLYQQLLADLRVPGAEDKDRWLTAMYLIEQWMEEHSDAKAALVQMRPSQQTGRAVSNGKLDNPFQGPHPDKRGHTYAGDRHIRAGSTTLQLHFIDLYDGHVADGNLIQERVPVIALWLDDPLRQDQIILGQAS